MRAQHTPWPLYAPVYDSTGRLMAAVAPVMPCRACPWTQKGQPDITAPVRAAAEAGEWFCCHVNMGTCHGAQLIHRAAIAKAQGGAA